MRARYAGTTSLLAAMLFMTAMLTGAPTAHAASAQVIDSCSAPDSPYLARCFAEKIVQPTNADGITPYTAQSFYGPSDLLNAYNLPNSTTTATVAIIDAYDDPTAQSDLDQYRAHFGLAPCHNGCFSKVNQNGAASPLPSYSSGWSDEISLDLDMVSAICASCHILLVEADSNGSDLYTAVAEAVAMGAKYVSMSWGASDNFLDTSNDSAFSSTGVAFVASSGDSSYGVNYPASSPHVLAVGGTSLLPDSSARGWNENVWDSEGGGPGSGCSSYEAKPAYQAGISGSVCAGRAVADVSAVADPDTGVAVYDRGGWGLFGGTSAAAPIIAATYALAGTPAAGSNPASYPYEYSQYLNDVTSGHNGSCSPAVLCTAGTGWDGPTGLGTPNGTGAFSATGTDLTRTAPVLNPPPVTTAPVTTAPVTTAPVTTAPVTTAPVTTPPVSTKSCLGQRVSNPTFASSRGWSATKGVLRRGSARLDGYGRAHTDRLTQAVVLPAGCAAILRVNLTISTKDSRANADRLTITVNGHQIALVTNRSRSGALTVNLSRYAGQRIVLSFTGTENASQVTAFTIREVSITS